MEGRSAWVRSGIAPRSVLVNINASAQCHCADGNSGDRPEMEEWLPFLAKWTLVPLATIAAFEGARGFGWGRSGRSAAVLLIFGIGVLGGYAGLLAWGTSNIKSTIKTLDRRPPPPLRESILNQITPHEREEKGRLLAQISFANAGVLATYITATGQHVRYAPSEKEIRDRETLRESLAQTRARVEFIRTQVWMLLLAGIAAVGAGISMRFCGRALP